MTKESKLLQAITDNFQKHVAKHQLICLDEMLPIFDNTMTIRGYFNQRCYPDLLELIKTNPTKDSHPLGSS